MIKLGDEIRETIESLESANISGAEFIAKILDAILAAYQEIVPEHDHDGVRIIFDEETTEFGIFAAKEVVSEVTNDFHEISLKEVQSLHSDIALGEIVEVEVTPEDVGELFKLAERDF